MHIWPVPYAQWPFLGTWDTILGALDGPWTALWRLMAPLSRTGATLSPSWWKECSIWEIIGTSFRPQGRQKSIKVIRKLKKYASQNQAATKLISNPSPSGPKCLKHHEYHMFWRVHPNPFEWLWSHFEALVGALFGFTFHDFWAKAFMGGTRREAEHLQELPITRKLAFRPVVPHGGEVGPPRPQIQYARLYIYVYIYMYLAIVYYHINIQH